MRGHSEMKTKMERKRQKKKRNAQRRNFAKLFDLPNSEPSADSSKKERTPIADRLVKNLGRYIQNKIIDFERLKVAQKDSEELQHEWMSEEATAKYHPSCGMYLYGQNQATMIGGEIFSCREMDCIRQVLAEAEEMYLPEGPPISPLTRSFFTLWTLFDACSDLSQETVGSTIGRVGYLLGIDDWVLRIIGLLQESKMAVYMHEGLDKDHVILRELMTDKVCRAVGLSEYQGNKGELWYARVLPSPVSDLDTHAVMTTPYVLLGSSEQAWLDYFERTLLNVPKNNRMAVYEDHMKYGSRRDYWNEFVFEGYSDYQPGAIFLRGLPDIPESRPCSSVNM